MPEYSWDYEIRKIMRVGHSCLIVLPPRFMRRLEFSKGQKIKITVKDNGLFLEAKESGDE